MTMYSWNPETDELIPAKYDILRDPHELWEPEHIALWKDQQKKVRVAESMIRSYWFSTVFLGLDHGWGGEPLLFETMILNFSSGRWLNYQERYPTGKKAQKAHEKLDRISRWLLLTAPQISQKNFAAVIDKV